MSKYLCVKSPRRPHRPKSTAGWLLNYMAYFACLVIATSAAIGATGSEAGKTVAVRSDLPRLAQPSGVLTTSPLLNGMTIRTANVVAYVKVRAKGMGPGFCAVAVSGGGKSRSLSAPPLSWSPWAELFSHTGSVTASLSTSINCGTGALFEVQYYR